MRHGHKAAVVTEKGDLKRVLESLSQKSVIFIALCTSPLFLLFTYFGDPGRGRAAAICGFVIVLGAKIFWSLKRHLLFWIALAILTCCHVPLIAMISWGNRAYPGVVLLPYALPDFAIVYGTFKLVEKLTRHVRTVADSNSETPGH